LITIEVTSPFLIRFKPVLSRFKPVSASTMAMPVSKAWLISEKRVLVPPVEVMSQKIWKSHGFLW
jgi:hypothetical protein